MNEHSLIARYFAPLTEGSEGAFGLADDAALFKPEPGFEYVITKDAIVEGVHYLPGTGAGDVARKLLRVNLSDLAAKGASPLYYLLACAFGDNCDEEFIAGFAEGLRRDQREFGIKLLGGDTVRTDGPPVFSLTAIGSVKSGRMVKRGGAKPGDKIFVTGTIGDAGLGLLEGSGVVRKLRVTSCELRVRSYEEFAGATSDSRLESHFAGPRPLTPDPYLLSRYLLPEPRVEFGKRLSEVASAAADVSDGLIADLDHICAASGVSARMHAEKIPLSDAAAEKVANGETTIEDLATAGDDYEIVFTAPAGNSGRIKEIAESTNTRVTEIGMVEEGAGVKFIKEGKEIPLEKKGFSHY